MLHPSKNDLLQHLSLPQLRNLAALFRMPGSHNSKSDLLERFTRHQRLGIEEILGRLTMNELCELAVALGIELSTNSKDEAIGILCGSAEPGD